MDSKDNQAGSISIRDKLHLLRRLLNWADLAMRWTLLILAWVLAAALAWTIAHYGTGQ